MKKQLNISYKLRTGLLALLVVCFASFISLSEAWANPKPVVSPTPQGQSSTFRTQPNPTLGSVAMNREVRVAKRALNKAMETGSVAPLLGYVGSIVGDGLDAVFGAGEKLLTKGFDLYESSATHQFLKEHFWGYNAGYNILKFANKGALKVVRFASRMIFGVSNRECNMERMNSIYKNGCYSCVVVKSLISSFINACSKVYDIAKEAGHKILVIGLMLWVAFFVLQQISSMKNIEPSAMVNDMLIMGFKVLGAYIVVGAGIDFFINYTIVPIMSWGSQFGTALLMGTSASTGIDIVNTQLDTTYLIKSAETGNVLPTPLLNNIMTYLAAVDGTVSTHLQVGHMVTCHATRAGAFNIGLIIPNFWIWICGAALWFGGFMMTLAVAFYLIDISFKLGFAILALPIVVGLWPFNITKGRLGMCISIILKSAGIFIFLAMTTAVGLALISNAFDVGSKADEMLIEAAKEQNVQIEEMGGTQKLMLAVEEGDSEYISNTFSLFGPTFIIILFAYLYAIKLIGSTVSDYVNNFFPDKVFKEDPMHKKLTQALAYTKSRLTKPVKKMGKIAKHQGKRLLKGDFGKPGGGSGGSNKFIKGLKSKHESINRLTEGNLGEKEKEKKQSQMDSALDKAKLKGSDKQEMEDAQKNSSGGGKEGTKNAAEQAEKSIEQSGKAASKTMDQGAKACQRGARSAAQTGNKLVAKGAAAYGVGLLVTALPAAACYASAAALAAASVTLKTAALVTKGLTMAMAKVASSTIKIASKMAKTTKKVAKQAQKTIKKVQNTVKKQSQKGKEKGNNKDKNNKNEDDGDSSNSGSNNGENDLMDTAVGIKGRKK